MEIRRYEASLWKKASRAATLLQLAPFVRFVAVTGSLGRGEAKPDSDADLFVVTEPHHLYTARVFALVFLQYTGLRINFERERIGGTVDPNYWLTSDNLDIEPHNAYVARDYSYMLPLWDASGIFLKLMHMNPWVAEYKRKFRDMKPPTPHVLLRFIQQILEGICFLFGSWLERWTRSVQEKKVREFAERRGKTDQAVIQGNELRLHL